MEKTLEKSNRARRELSSHVSTGGDYTEQELKKELIEIGYETNTRGRLTEEEKEELIKAGYVIR